MMVISASVSGADYPSASRRHQRRRAAPARAGSRRRTARAKSLGKGALQGFERLFLWAEAAQCRPRRRRLRRRRLARGAGRRPPWILARPSRLVRRRDRRRAPSRLSDRARFRLGVRTDAGGREADRQCSRRREHCAEDGPKTWLCHHRRIGVGRRDDCRRPD